MVADGTCRTPVARRPATLDGITPALADPDRADLDYEVVERSIARAELYLADEVFVTGTAAELVPMREVDDHVIGEGVRGPVTTVLQRVFEGRPAWSRTALRGVARPRRSARRDHLT